MDNAEHETVVVLPISGPLGEPSTYAPTNLDLLNNAYKQNAAINVVGSKVQRLSTTVANHAQVIGELVQIKRIAIGLVSLVGLSGFVSIINWIKLWLAHA